MGSKSQRKGASGERELATILRERGYDCQRGGSLTFGEVPDLTGLPGIHAEIKRVEKLNVVEAMEQAIRDSQRMQDGVPALFHRRNRKPWLVTMRLVDWLELFEANKTLTKRSQNAGSLPGNSREAAPVGRIRNDSVIQEADGVVKSVGIPDRVSVLSER